MTLLWLGFDPGGIDGFGVAALYVEAGVVDANRSCWATVSSTDEALEWVEMLPGDLIPSGSGIDTLMYWASCRGGWREADHCLRREYPEARLSVMAPNGLAGSMAIQGMSLAILLRGIFEDHRISEGHPKVLYLALRGVQYPRAEHLGDQLPSMFEWLGGFIGLGEPTGNDHELDAILSAYAAWKGLEGEWAADLRALDQGNVIEPAGPVNYWWPELPAVA